MALYDLSILIPARNEMFLAKTVEDILANIEGKTEVIVVLDGAWANPGVPDDNRVSLIYNSQSIGQRAATNQAAKLSKAKYLMKCDAHCSFDKGFDVKMIKEMHDDWTMVPLMKNLHAFDWLCPNGHRRYQGPSGPCLECGKETVRDVVWIAKEHPQSVSYCFDSAPHFQYFGDYPKRPEGKGEITETMSLQGSCWMLTRDKYWELDVCDEKFGSWGSQGIEVAVKTWLSGGRVMVNKKTWYAHMFRTQGGDFGFPYPISGKDQEKAKDYARDLFFNNKWDKQIHPLSWLVEKFWPVKGWSEEDLKKLKGNTFRFSEKAPQVKPAESEPVEDTPTSKVIYSSSPNPTKGIIFYTDNQLKIKIAHAVQHQLRKISEAKGIPIVSASLKPMPHFGKNIYFPHLKRGYLAYFTQILGALENSSADIIYFCFQGNTYIETSRGLKRIDNIKTGELVKTHLGRFKPVTHIFKTPYLQRKPLIQINTQNSFVRCTPEHPFYIARNSKKQWVQANKIIKGDLLLYPCKTNDNYLDLNIDLKSSPYGGRYGSTDRKITNLKVDEKLARFMGLYVAEGHFNGKNGIGFTFHNDEVEYQDFIKTVCLEKFGRSARERKTWATQILINIHGLGPKFKQWFGNGAGDKHIPKFVFNWGLKNRLSFILGLLNGDAAWNKQYGFYVGLSSTSKRLIGDTIKLMNESGVGWDNTIKIKQNTGSFSQKSQYKLWVNRINLSKKSYMKILDLLHSTKVDNKYLGIEVANTIKTRMSAMPKHKDSKRIGYENYVYNLEVADDNSYIAQSSIVHNCEHDVLYPPSHFDFTPPKEDIYYYNQNWWRLRTTDGFAVHWDANQVSGLCAYRKHLLKFYKERIEEVKKKGYKNTMGFEPGGRHTNLTASWKSEVPCVDVKHGHNLSKNKWSLKDFRDKSTAKNFVTGYEIPGWGKTVDLIKEFN